jgi:hypothetical protein
MKGGGYLQGSEQPSNIQTFDGELVNRTTVQTANSARVAMASSPVCIRCQERCNASASSLLATTCDAMPKNATGSNERPPA